MAAPSVGAVVLVRFPFSDLTRTKLRPAAVVAHVDRGDSILCQITSNRYADPEAIELRDEHFSHGGLQRTSYARPGKLFTANEALIVRSAGTLKTDTHRAITESIIQLLQKNLL